MPSRERQGRAKRREEYIQNRDGELETSRVRYNGYANRASIQRSVCCDEQSYDLDQRHLGIVLYLATYNARGS